MGANELGSHADSHARLSAECEELRKKLVATESRSEDLTLEIVRLQAMLDKLEIDYKKKLRIQTAQPPPSLTGRSGESEADRSEYPLSLPEFDRSAHAVVDETRIISFLFEMQRPEAGRTMIDVGAHSGGSMSHFVDKGWRIYGFEPDVTNRTELIAKFGKRTNVIIDERAVGEKAELQKPFYSSAESSGISGLHRFRETHRQTALVDVTTISEIIEHHGLNRIDFLKIDTEGWDLHVLRGVPWNRLQPKVIECEFEDLKTLPLGYDQTKMAEFLVGKGYVVYVSEWHPIIRYGIKHDWCRLSKYPAALRSPEAWGNFLAFLDDPGLSVMRNALNSSLRVGSPVSDNANVTESAKSSRSSNTTAVQGRSANTEMTPRILQLEAWLKKIRQEID